MRDVKPVLAWARAHGDSKIVDRVIVRLLPQLQAHGLQLSGAQVEADDQIMVPDPVYDLVNETILRATGDAPLEIPARAVVVAGSRPVTRSDFAREHGLHIYAPLIVKYRDDKTDLRAALEGDLR